jgi:hypothetical protein
MVPRRRSCMIALNRRDECCTGHRNSRYKSRLIGRLAETAALSGNGRGSVPNKFCVSHLSRTRGRTAQRASLLTRRVRYVASGEVMVEPSVTAMRACWSGYTQVRSGDAKDGGELLVLARPMGNHPFPIQTGATNLAMTPVFHHTFLQQS